MPTHSRSFTRTAPAAIGFSLILAGSAAAQGPCGTPGATADGWRIAKPADVGIAPQMSCGLTERFGAWKEANVHAILIARHGKLLYEQYFAGIDSQWGQPETKVTFGPEVPHDLRSITKSVVSLVVGVGMTKGWLTDVDRPVLELLPAYADLASPEKRHITLRHLLTMSDGLQWNEELPYSDPNNSEIRMDISSDPCRFVLEQPVAHPAGTVWNYDGGSTALVACILQAKTGKAIDVLAKEGLFEPLGISKVEWARYPKNGAPAAASGLRLLPADTLKLGQLVLDKGKWNGRQIIAESWIGEATSPQVNGPGSLFYGFQFWLGRSLADRKEIDWIAGIGYGGQRLYIVPSLDLVVLVHAGIYANSKQDWLGSTILNQYVLPAVVR